MDYSQLTDAQILSLCVWREARSSSTLDWQAVAHVILNRVRHGGWWGHDIHSVILAKWQFSSFNHGDPNEEKTPEPSDASYQSISGVCDAALAGEDFDPTQGACWYHDHSIEPPEWTAKLQVALKTPYFTFYREPTVMPTVQPDITT